MRLQAGPIDTPCDCKSDRKPLGRKTSLRNLADELSFRHCGRNVVIHATVRILRPEVIVLGDNVIIDDFVFIGAHESLVIGNHVHIGGQSSLIGGGRLYLSDFVGMSHGARVLSGSDDFLGGGLTNPTIPAELRHVHRGTVWFGPHSGLGANAVVIPDVAIGEGSAVAAGSVVMRSLAPWGIYGGQPARRIKSRPDAHIRAGERELYRRYGCPERVFRDPPPAGLAVPA